MEHEGLKSRHDTKSPGRPRLLNAEQERTIKGGIDGTPRDSGFERGSWKARMLAKHILERFGRAEGRVVVAVDVATLAIRLYLAGVSGAGEEGS